MPHSIRRHHALAALLAAGCAVVAFPAAPAHAASHRIVVAYEPPSTGQAARSSVAERPFVVKHVKDMGKALRALRRSPRVRYAVRDVKAHAAAFIPNDPGRGAPGGWAADQWNFIGPFSVNAPDAWQHLIDAGHPGGNGVTVAVLDSGVAYAARTPYLRSPDLKAKRFVKGYDFVSDDPYANDRYGHGTHVASTIAEATNNGVALTGLAYGATIMPVRVLNNVGEGDASVIAAGVRFAAKNGAQVINLSLEFPPDVGASEIPQLIDAIAYAHRRGVVIVAAAGNEAHGAVAYPARAHNVISVGATTEHGCLSDFSNEGRGLDLVAPGGGTDAALAGDVNCHPFDAPGRNIYQLTLSGNGHRHFGYPGGYKGTSMACPHVAALAALIIASGVIGQHPSPQAVEAYMKKTARDLGPLGPDQYYGAGLIDAAAATAPPAPPVPVPVPVPPTG